MVRIDCPYDFNPEDNKSSLSVYVGQMQDYTQYKGDYVCCDIDNPTMTYGIYKLNVLFITNDYFRADVLVNNALLEPLVRFNPGEPHYYLGGNLLIFCNITDSSSQYACAFIGEPNEPNPFNYTPSTPHFSQGTTGILKVECPTGSEFRNFHDGDIILTDDTVTVSISLDGSVVGSYNVNQIVYTSIDNLTFSTETSSIASSSIVEDLDSITSTAGFIFSNNEVILPNST